MRVIVPGGYYSYDSAGKKIWLDYQYYGTTLENIERVKNLTRNKILYDCKRSTVLPTVENGCITHSYPGNEADEDKIQVTLRTPITNSLTELTPVDGVVTLETDGKVLVLPTEDAAILPSFNQSVLNSDRLTIAESPFGGLKTGSPDYCPGTLYTATDGVNLTDVNGQNSTKTLTAGMLKGVNGLTVDPVAHTITQEFIVANTSTANAGSVLIVSGSDTTNYYNDAGTDINITTNDSIITVSGTTNVTGILQIHKNLTLNLSSYNLVSFRINPSVNCALVFYLRDSLGNQSGWFGAPRFNLTANIWNNFVFALKAPQGGTGANPNYVGAGAVNWANIIRFIIGISSGGNAASVSFSFSGLTADTSKTTTIEAHVPDNLAATSLSLYTHNGTAYQLCSTHSLDGVYSQVSQTSANCTFADGTLLDHVYGTGLGRAVFPKGVSGATVNGSIGAMTYSANKGTSKRIGFRVDLPPSDGGRTNFNKIRLKTILTYAPDAEDNYSASYDFADSTNTSYGLQNLSKPWIALYDPTSNLIDFYLFTYRPKNLEFKKDESGTIYEVKLYPGNGLIYHGQITFSDLTLDTNSDTIPDCLEASINGSVTKFLANYSYANTTQFLIDSNDYYLLDSDDKTLEV